jgi:hypothetical protein
MSIYNPLDVWLCEIKYEDNLGNTKARPVVIVEDESTFILVVKITSHKPRNNFCGEYALQRWKEAGLRNQSTVRAGNRLKVSESDFIHRIGKLHTVDATVIKKILLACKLYGLP